MPGRPIHSVYFPLTIDTATSSHYEVPVGFTAVLRDMRFWVRNQGLDPTVQALVVALDADTDIVWEIQATNASRGVYTWTGHQVFSIVMQVTTFNQPWNLRASGYLLTNP